jgi:hypothetical protein
VITRRGGSKHFSQVTEEVLPIQLRLAQDQTESLICHGPEGIPAVARVGDQDLQGVEKYTKSLMVFAKWAYGQKVS